MLVAVEAGVEVEVVVDCVVVELEDGGVAVEQFSGFT